MEEKKYSEPKDYNKLVRDKMIEHIKGLWKDAIFHIASPEEKFPKAMEKLREELAELKEAIQVMEKLQTETELNSKNIEEKKKDVHREAADVLEIRNTIIENFTGVMPTDGREEINVVTSYLSSITLKYNLEIDKIFKMKEEKLSKKWWFSEWIILEKS